MALVRAAPPLNGAAIMKTAEAIGSELGSVVKEAFVKKLDEVKEELDEDEASGEPEDDEEDEEPEEEIMLCDKRNPPTCWYPRGPIIGYRK